MAMIVKRRARKSVTQDHIPSVGMRQAAGGSVQYVISVGDHSLILTLEEKERIIRHWMHMEPDFGIEPGENEMSKILLSPKHGLNPSLMLCFFCNEAKGVALLGLRRERSDAAAPPQGLWDREPCDQCKSHMAKGVILISVRDGEGGDNPYRTGGWCVIRDEAIERMLHPPAAADLLKRRVAFIEDKMWDAIGLPRGEQS